MNRLFTLCLSLFTALIFSIHVASAQDANDNTPKVEISIDHAPYALKGEKTPLIITQNIIPHWHTYWINFGDSGEEMKINWELPEGTSVDALQFPLPKRINYGPLVNFGHEGAPQFLTHINVPQDFKNNALNITANVKWLVCKEICIPEKQQLSFSIPVVSQAPEDNEDSAAQLNDFTQKLDTLKNALPQKTLWQGHFQDSEDAIHFQINIPSNIFETINSDASNLQFFPYEYGLTNHATPIAIHLAQKGDNNFVDLKLGKGDMSIDEFEAYKILLMIDDKGYYVNTKKQRAEAAKDNNQIAPPVQDETPVSAPLEESQKIEEPQASKQNTLTQHNLNPAKPEFKGLEAKIHSFVLKFTPEGSDPFFITFLFFAFLGGLILNLMPCVFPVLSMKALSVVKLADTSFLRLWGNGIFYTLGVLASFGAIAATLLLLRQGGSEIGWGFQLQNPNIIIILSWLIFAVGLNLSGIFHVSLGRAEGIGAGLATKPGLGGAFFTGMLATLVATPCTAAFMGTALGAAIVLPTMQALSIFLMLGFGLAFPYLIICLIPPLVRLLPRPGAWMETFRQFLAFPMYATAIWLVWVAVRQIGDIGLIYTLGGMLILGFAVWLLRHSKNSDGDRNSLTMALAFLCLIIPFVALALNAQKPTQPISKTITKTQNDISTEIAAPIIFDEDKLMDILQNTDRPVFVNMTASWCITCLYNERTTLSKDEVKNWMAKHNVVYMKGDWTNYDDHITRYLASFGRNGVPLYVYYAKPDENNVRPAPVLLPQILSTSQIIANQP